MNVILVIECVFLEYHTIEDLMSQKKNPIHALSPSEYFGELYNVFLMIRFNLVYGTSTECMYFPMQRDEGGH